jgi:AcrR family transcriptional regulator
MAKQDGRNLRSINSQKLIVDACIKLFKAGNLEPTAQQVADESGVGIRTVFRQFDEMENLYKAVDAVFKQRIMILRSDMTPLHHLRLDFNP